MSIRAAKQSDRDIVKEITHTTINKIYPHYANRTGFLFLKIIYSFGFDF